MASCTVNFNFYLFAARSLTRQIKDDEHLNCSPVNELNIAVHTGDTASSHTGFDDLDRPMVGKPLKFPQGGRKTSKGPNV